MQVLTVADVAKKFPRPIVIRYRTLFEAASMAQRSFGLVAARGEKELAKHVELANQLVQELKDESDRLIGLLKATGEPT